MEKTEKLVKRSDKKAFYRLPDSDSTFTRIKYFTEMSISKNPKEYSRQYVDENNERTDVVGYSPSLSFSFDEYTGDEVLEDIVSIIDGEMLGTDAQRDILFVDFSEPIDSGTQYRAVKRTFAIIADSEGDGTDAYTYSGTMRAVGPVIKGTAGMAEPVEGTPETVIEMIFVPDSE